MKTFFQKLRYQAISVFFMGSCFFLVSIHHLIMASVPDNLGHTNHLLLPCPRTPNCVSSLEKNSLNLIKPITYKDSLEQAKERIFRVIKSMRGTRIVSKEDLYWSVEFTSLLLRFIDDVEFYFDRSQSLIHVRSSSRKGYWDLGVNRRRIETIRSRFEKFSDDTD